MCLTWQEYDGCKLLTTSKANHFDQNKWKESQLLIQNIYKIACKKRLIHSERPNLIPAKPRVDGIAE